VVDYTGILKRAWQITWKYKILWLFGLFAGGMGGGGGGNGGGSGNTGTGSRTGGNVPGWTGQQFSDLVQRSLPLVVALILMLVVVGIVLWVISIAARGGIVHLVNEAEEGRPVRAGDGWRVGFSKWGRVFGILFLTGLPIFLLALVMVGLLFMFGLGGVLTAAGTQGNRALASGIGALGGMCCVLFVFVIALIVLGVVLGIVAELATRYGVLKDMGVMDSLRAGWADLRAKRGAFMMWLIQLGVSIAYGIVVGIVAVLLILPGGIAFFAGAWPVGVLMIVFAGLILLVPAAAYGAFYHTVWTLFFRRMTGMEVRPALGVPGAYPGGSTAFPPPPPTAGDYMPPPPPSAAVGPVGDASGADVPAQPPAPWETPPEPDVPAPWDVATTEAADPWKAANDLPQDASGAPDDPPAGG
jgi:hypothetical protein